MNARLDRPGPLPENMLGVSVVRRAWHGVNVDVTEFRCNGRVVHRLSHDAEARLSVVLEEVGAPCEPRLHEDRPCPIVYAPRHMLYAPAGLPVWGYSADTRYVKDATLTFDRAQLEQQLDRKLDETVVSAPRLRFVDDRIWTLVKLLADAVDDPDPSAQLYGDGLATAIAASLVCRSPATASNAEGQRLAPWQLRRVLEYLDDKLPAHVTLAELAGLAGLSAWHFSRAFKASTGTAPYRWQLAARIRRAQALLLDARASLEEVAAATGFADAVHFGKTFRRIAGTTPAAWRKDHKA